MHCYYTGLEKKYLHLLSQTRHRYVLTMVLACWLTHLPHHLVVRFHLSNDQKHPNSSF